MENNTQISGVITTAIISNMNNNYFEINYSKEIILKLLHQENMEQKILLFQNTMKILVI